MTKQTITHEQFLALRREGKTLSREHFDRKFGAAVEQVASICKGKRAAYSWSGGKDSLVMAAIAEAAGVSLSFLAICRLEYPAFLQWVTENMPPRLKVYDTGQDWEWLERNQQHLFPLNHKAHMVWFSMVQHRAQKQFQKDYDLDVLLLGRRRDDGNFVGRNGENHYVNDGVLRLSPIADWKHPDIFSAIEFLKLPVPPIYSWPRGYRIGTHPWPGRMWCGSIENGWDEIMVIDPSLVHEAARRKIKGAGECLARHGGGR